MGLKEAYQEKMEAQLKEWSADIEKLKAKAATASADVKVEYYTQIEAIKAKHQNAHGKLQELSKSNEAAWENLKAGAENSIAELRKGLNNAFDKFK